MGSAKIVVLTNLACVLSLMSCGSGRNKNQSSHSRDPLLMDLTQFESTEDQVQLSQYDECKQFQNEKDKWVIPAFKEYFISGDFRGQESKDLSTAPYVYYYGYVFANEKAPIIFYNGGPTSDSHSSFEAFSTLSDEFKKLIQNEQSFIFMDQRGTGCSDTYLNSGMESEALFLDYIQHLQNDWASSSIVADSEILRKELFGDKIKWKVYGQSYGALIAQRYIEIAPQGLSSVHAHGFAFTDYKTFNRSRYYAQKVVFEQFLIEYPSAKTAVEHVYAWLDSGVCFHNGDAEEKICGRQALDSFVEALAFKLNWSDIADVFGKLAPNGEVNPETVGKLVKYLNYVGGSSDPATSIAGTVISKTEIDVGRDVNDPSGCLDAINYWQQQGHTNSEWYLAECRPEVYSQETKDIFKLLFSLPAKLVDIETIKKNIDQYKIPFFLYSGEYDPLVPKALYEKELEILGASVHYTNFPKSAHEGFLTEPLVWENLSRVDE